MGLFVGKPLGIVLMSWLAVRIGMAEFTEGIKWRQVLGVGFLAGIGFTMSLFITNLAFPEGVLLEYAKLGILMASLLAGITGFILLYFSDNK